MAIKEALTHIKQLKVVGAATEHDVIAIALVAECIDKEDSYAGKRRTPIRIPD